MGTHRADLRTNNFDFLRFLFASLVILSHSFNLLRLGEREPLYRATSATLDIGSVAVFAFFAISGFLVTASWTRSTDAADYFKKRVLRIYPGFIVAIALSYFVVAPLAGCQMKELLSLGNVVAFTRESIFFQPLSRPTAFARLPVPNDINGSVWSIKYEFLCYILLAMIGALGLLGRRRFVASAFTGLVFVYLIAKMHEILPDFHGIYLPLVLGRPITLVQHSIYFFSGIAAYLYRDRLRYSIPLACFALAALVVSSWLPATLAFVVPCAFTYLVFWFAFEPRIKLSHFGRFGDYSYGIYLYAFPIQQLLILWLGPKVGPWGLFAISWPLSIAAGALSWFMVERPFLKRKPHPVAAVAVIHDAMPKPHAG